VNKLLTSVFLEIFGC